MFFALIVLKSPKSRNQNNLFLSVLIFSFGICIFESLVRTSGRLIFSVPLYRVMLYHFFSGFYYLIGPFLLFFLRKTTERDFVFKRIHLMHFVPFVIFLFFESSINSLMLLRFSHLFVYLLVYWRLAFLCLKKSSKPDAVAARNRFVFIKFIGILFSVLSVTDIAFFFLRIYSGYVSVRFEKWLFLWKALVTVYLSFKFLAAPEISKFSREKSPGSVLTEDELEYYLKKLMAYIKKHRPFLNPNLTVRDLSSELSIPYWHISEVIHRKYGQNFQKFINTFRIDEARRLMEESGKKRSLLNIAYQSGFNTKSTFNGAFKTIMNQTPSQYRKTLAKR